MKETSPELDVEQMVTCPAEDCEVQLPASDWRAQGLHLKQYHPQILARRQAEAERLDGWIVD